MADRWAEPLIRPHLMKFAVRSGNSLQKKHIRSLLGWARPIICPVCNEYTKQEGREPQTFKFEGKDYLLRYAKRKCLSCLTVFDRADSRGARRDHLTKRHRRGHR